jgi:uncharacterized protein HemY
VEAESLHAAACVVLHADDMALAGQAVQACRAALERMPGAPEMLITLGGLLLLQGQSEEAEQHLQAACKRTRDPMLEDRCMAYLAWASRRLGRERDEALFRHALQARHPGARLQRLLDAKP